MAIRSKGSLIGNKNTANTSTNVSEVLTNASTNNSNNPEDLVEIPENNPEHESSPEDFHTTAPGWTLWSSFEEAKDAANLVYLKRGEAHTEFYKENDEYHCVVAIGNIVPNSDHLILTDSGSEYSIDDRLDQMNSSIFDLGQYVTYYTKIINKLNSSINEFEHSVTNALEEILLSISNFEEDVNENIANLDILINNVSTFVSEISEITSSQIEDISTYVSEFDSRITINENNIVIINSSISDIKSQLEASNASINVINNNISEINSSINDINNKIDNINIDIDSNILNINSSISDIKTRLDENDNNIDDINDKLDVIDSSINTIKTKLDENDNNIDDINDKLHDVNSSINLLENELELTNENISNINSNLLDIDSSINTIETRLDENDNNIDDINNKLNVIDNSINGINNKIDTINNNINSSLLDINSSISDIENKILNIDNIDASLVNINSSISSLNSQVENNTSNIEFIEGELNTIGSSINDINSNLNNINSNLEQSNASINSLEDIANEQYEFIEDLLDDVFDINASIRSIKESFNTYVRETDEFLINLDSSIEDINYLLNKLNTKLLNINSSVSRLNTSVNILEELQLNTSTRLSEIDITLVDVNKSIRNINSSIYNIVSTLNLYDEDIDIINSNITLLGNRVLGHDRDIIDINNKISSINSSISYITNDINTINNDIINVKDAIENERLRNNSLDYSIETLNSSVNWILETMSCKCALIEEEIRRNNIQDISINLLTLAINDLQDQMNEFLPIEDVSIYPLFRDDIYTINLCCYTNAGYIEINDHIAGTDIIGGRSRRVAECTPFNEYKTYVHGDVVDFIAHNNPGYKFVCWYIDGNTNNPYYNADIPYTFGDDINVIGSLLDGMDPDILEHGYTAKFKRLHQLKVSINRITNTIPTETYVKYVGDTLSIRITEPGLDPKDVSLEDALKGNVYYDDGAKIQIIASEDTEHSHKFNRYEIFDGEQTIEWTPKTYTNLYATTDLIIDSYFTEYWIMVSGDATADEGGRVFINAENDEYKQISPRNNTYYLGNSSVTISVDTNDNYGFEEWISRKPSHHLFIHSIQYPYTEYDEFIKITVNPDVDEYELRAKLVQGLIQYDAEFYYDDSYESMYAKKKYGDSSIVYAPEVDPTMPGAIFNNWICEDPAYIIDASIIDQDLRFYATWEYEEYDVSFYSKGEFIEEYPAIRYNTPFSALRVEDPSNVNVGETFHGWMVGTNLINENTYLIQGPTTFDASITVDLYDVKFVVDGYLVKEDSVIYNTTLGSIKPADPVKTGYEFKCWENATSYVDDSYQIQHDEIFAAVFELIDHEVTFNDDNRLTILTVNDNEIIPALDIPTPLGKEGYRFIEWTNDDGFTLNSPITLDTEFDAQYEINRYNVLFNVQGNIYDASIVNYGTLFEDVKPTIDPEVSGYVFKYWKWFGTDTSVLNTDPIVEDSSFDAELLQLIYHSITLFDDPEYPTVPYLWVDKVLDGSTLLDALNMIPGYVDPSTMGPAYDFVGWSVNDVIVYPNRYHITEDTSFYAKYEIKTFNLTFYDDYGYEEVVENVSYGETFGYAKSLLENQPTPPAGYAFNYWGTYIGGELVEMHDNDEITSTQNFVAVYREDIQQFTVGFTTDSGNFILDGQDLVGKTLTYTTTEPIDPTILDASFDGWYNGNTKVSDSSSYSVEITSEMLPLQLDAKFISESEPGGNFVKCTYEGHEFEDGDIIVLGYYQQQTSQTLLLANQIGGTGTKRYGVKTAINGDPDELDVDTINQTLDPPIQKIKLHKIGNAFALESIDSTGSQSTNLGFYYWVSENSLLLDEEVTLETLENRHLWSITIHNNGTAIITNVGSSDARFLQYNISATRYACYTNSQNNPTIFLLQSSLPKTYINPGVIAIMSEEQAFDLGEEIEVTALNNTALQLTGWNDDAGCVDDLRTIIAGVTVDHDWTYMPYYGTLYIAKFKQYNNNYTWFESTVDSDINVEVDGDVENNTIIEGTIGTPTHWIDNAYHPKQAQFYTEPFWDGTVGTWTDHWVPVFTTEDYFEDFNKCILSYCVNNNQARGGAKIKMAAIDDNGDEIAYAYGNGTIDGEVSKEVGITVTPLVFSNWYIEDRGEKRLYKNLLGTNIIPLGKVRMYLKMCQHSLFITSFEINGTKHEN